MAGRPGGKTVQCPQCGEIAYAIVPKDSTLTNDEDTADRKVRVNCHECEDQFYIYFRNK